MSTILFVGQAPGRDKLYPFIGKSGYALARLLGIEYANLFDQHRLINLVDVWQGKSGKGDRFDPSGIDCAAKVAHHAEGVHGIVLCGGTVAKACGVTTPFLDQFMLHGKPALVLPHPSGVNRWWNDARNKKSAQRRLRRFVSAANKRCS
jgi:uracil-DNA glycosylase